MTRITIACPEKHIPDANQLARASGLGPDDDQTFGAATWADATGNLYAAASFEASDGWLAAVRSPMKSPGWGANMSGARRAQALIVLWTPEAETPPPLARPDRLTAVIGLGGIDALAAIGLAQVTAETAI